MYFVIIYSPHNPLQLSCCFVEQYLTGRNCCLSHIRRIFTGSDGCLTVNTKMSSLSPTCQNERSQIDCGTIYHSVITYCDWMTQLLILHNKARLRNPQHLVSKHKKITINSQDTNITSPAHLLHYCLSSQTATFLSFLNGLLIVAHLWKLLPSNFPTGDGLQCIEGRWKLVLWCVQ